MSPIRLIGVALLALGAAATAAAAFVALRRPPVRRSAVESSFRADAGRAAAVLTDQQILIDSILEFNPFGESQAITDPGTAQRLGSGPGMSEYPGNPAPPRLAAIAGPPWSAIMTFDGAAMAVPVAVRDSVRGFHVVTIARDYVVLRARDSTFRVTLAASKQ